MVTSDEFRLRLVFINLLRAWLPVLAQFLAVLPGVPSMACSSPEAASALPEKRGAAVSPQSALQDCPSEVDKCAWFHICSCGWAAMDGLQHHAMLLSLQSCSMGFAQLFRVRHVASMGKGASPMDASWVIAFHSSSVHPQS